MDYDAILYNLDAARRFLSAVPSHLYDLDVFECNESCGTLMCSFGHLTRSPHFMELGMVLRYSQPAFLVNGYAVDDFHAVWSQSDTVFGPDSHQLFVGFGASKFDDYPEAASLRSHKLLALFRFDCQIRKVSALAQ